ncbi:MAG: hypothetical protein ACLFRY_12090 [Spirochaetia bacterium]
MRIYSALLILIMALTPFLTGCEEEEGEGKNTQLDPAAELPLLSEGQFPGLIVGFNPSNPPATTDAIEARWQEALDAGLRVGRLQIDWDELEPRPGEYNTAALEVPLKVYSRQDLQTFLLVSVYDSEGPVVPEYLEGVPLDDTELISRFQKLMDWVVPMLISYDGYLISVANEAGNSFGEVPGLHEEVFTFLQEARRYIHGIDDRMAVTATVAEGNIGIEKPGVQELIEESDVACFNFYGAVTTGKFPYAKAQSRREIRSDIERMLRLSGSKQIVIQELGMWSGSNLLPSNAEIQRRFFETFFEEMEKNERIRAAYVFQLVDWSPETSDILAQMLRAENVAEDFVGVFIESLETIGLTRYEDGQARPAWDEFLLWLERFSGS